MRAHLIALVLLAASGTALAQGQIIVVPFAEEGEGFDDQTPADPVGGNDGTTVGEQRLNVFLRAAEIWQETVKPTNDIYIAAEFVPLGPGVLGAAGTEFIHRDFPGAELPNTWYPDALADQLAGTDLNPCCFDIDAVFSSDFEFYLGFDNNEDPATQVDLLVVVLHELGHGLGFANFVDEATGMLADDTPDIYSQYTLDVSTGKIWNEMTDAERLASAINVRKVSWSGLQVNRHTREVLDRGEPGVKILSPSGFGTLEVGPATFGPAYTPQGVTGKVVLAQDAVVADPPSTGTDGCTAITNDVRGKIAMIDRGTCAFTVKVKNAQDAGAIGVLLADNVVDSPPPPVGGEDATITIPSGRIAKKDADALKPRLAAGVRARIFQDITVLSGVDRIRHLMLLSAFDPVSPGSSISHFDAIATPNQLMESFVNDDLTSSVTPPEDLTTPLLTDLGWFTDRDGVQDGVDLCLGSDTRPTVVLGTCDSGVTNSVGDAGCSISDVLNVCAPLNDKNHLAYVACVAVTSALLKQHGDISGRDVTALSVCALRNR